MTVLASYRRLTLVLATIVFSYNLFTAHALNHLPDEPLQLASHLSTYCYFAALLSVLGFIGAKRQNATMVAIFANYFIIDVFISAAPRILALSFIPDIRSAVCSRDSIVAFFEAHQPQPAPGTSRVDMMGPEERERMELSMERQCGRVLNVLMGLMALGALIITIIQVMLAVRISTYSRVLQKLEAESQQRAAQQEPAFTDEKKMDQPRSRSSSLKWDGEEKRGYAQDA